MIELSRFDSFIAGLNTFVANKGALARLDTPIRIIFSYLDKASDTASRTGQMMMHIHKFYRESAVLRIEQAVIALRRSERLD
ncbi:MAG: hypothetical protein IPI79_04265 [Moraxellaceae bacterium]|nr:hypothetical protein [Moraxellaceae bacterium]